MKMEDGIRIRSAGVSMTQEEWSDYCRTTYQNPEKRITTQIGKYLFNDCDVCLNPEVLTIGIGGRKNGSLLYSVTLKWCDCGNGLWSIGVDYSYSQGGGGSGCSYAETDDKNGVWRGYKSEREAIIACCDRAMILLGSHKCDAKVRRLMEMVSEHRKDIARPRPVQLDLFW